VTGLATAERGVLFLRLESGQSRVSCGRIRGGWRGKMRGGGGRGKKRGLLEVLSFFDNDQKG